MFLWRSRRWGHFNSEGGYPEGFGSTPSLLPTMLGGSVPSQTSGAPYRSESGSRPAAWPPPAHQSDIFNRGYGVYSLFPGPGDTPRALYTPIAKSSHPSSFQSFEGTQKVSDSFFSKRFAFESTGVSQFDSSSRPEIELEVSQLDLTSNSFSRVSRPYSPTGRKSEEQNVSAQRESKSKLFSNDFVIIKTEVEEGNKLDNFSLMERQSFGKIKRIRNNHEERNGIPKIESECTSVRMGGTPVIEADSTEFKISNESHSSEDVITTSDLDHLEEESVTSENEIGLCIANTVEGPDGNDIIENVIDKEKCNRKMIDSINEGNGGKLNKPEKFSVKVESVNDICSRPTEKKYTKEKAPGSNCTNSLGSLKKLYNEPSKPFPTRTLSLPPQNGGCSRTTPVTFKHTSQQESDPKPQNLHIEVPPLLIKKEPSEFQKNSNGASFLSPGNLDNFFSPGGLNVLDGQLTPYSSSFEPSNRQKENFLSPLDQNFLSPNQAFLSPRPVTDTPYLSSNLDMGRFGGYKNYHRSPKIGENYMMNEINEKATQSLPSRENMESEDTRVLVNSSNGKNELKNKMSENIACNGCSVTPCQVAEVTSASSLLSPNHSNVNPLLVKQEMTASASNSGSSIAASAEQNKEIAFMTSGQSTMVSSTVEVSTTKQRRQQRPSEIKMPSNDVPSPPVMHRTVQSPPSIDLPPALGAAVFASGMMDDRSANLITTWPAQSHNPTLWQYSAPIDYPPLPPVGFQLVRDPVTGHFLLMPASNLEALQRAILWPGYQTTPPQMIIPPLSVQPSTPHILLESNAPAVDFLTSETIHHSASQHRILISSDNTSKRKSATPTMIKLEASDCPKAVVVTTCDNNNIYTKTQPPSLSPRRELPFHPQKTLASTDTGKRCQATSPCLTPVLDSLSNHSDSKDSDICQLPRSAAVTLQDASNQTDLPFIIESEESTSVMCKDKFIPYTKTTEQCIKMAKTQDAGTETIFFQEPEDDKGIVLREIKEKKKVDESLNISCVDVPHPLTIKKELVSPSQVDLSGLELLSNSIEQFVSDTKSQKIATETKNHVKNIANNEDRKDLSNDACEGAVLLQNLRNGFREVEEHESYVSETLKNLGGLGLLCALAAQRFQEEIGKEIKSDENVRLDENEEIGEEKRQKNVNGDLDCRSENNGKQSDLESNCWNDNDDLPKLKKEVEKICNEKPETENQKTISKNQCEKDKDNFVAAIEEVLKRGPGRPKKFKNVEKDNLVLKSFSPYLANNNSKEMSPPILEKETDFSYNEKSELRHNSVTINSKEDILKPPTLTPSATLDPVIKCMAGTLELTHCEVSLVTLKVNKDKLKKQERGEGITVSEGEAKKRKLSDCDILFSSSKKRKVGRPKKHHLLDKNSMTETIVAKKPKTKPYLFQPVQTVDKNLNSHKTKNNDVTVEKNSFFTFEEDAMNVYNDAEDEEKKSKKIRPKLKAEPKVKEWAAVEDEENMERRKNMKKEDNCKQKIKSQKKVFPVEKKFNECSGINGKREPTLPNCEITTEHLKSDKFPMRTLTVMGGLFYAGQLSAIRAPDVYGITIDGERGNRPHIYSREEILKDSILEVRPEKTGDLPPGTRCCAYWSEQYRCLYPGTVSAPVSPYPELDDKFVNVEFDDGDSGKIRIDDIRLLPVDYPIIEYDPNPLQSLSKRKRRISGASVDSHSKEMKSVDSLPNLEKNENDSDVVSGKPEAINEEAEPKKPAKVYEPGSFLSLKSERRHLKKKRREKLKRLQLLSVEGKKKHKKHKCSDEHRHHRHHKKHRKHKHKHGKKRFNEVSGDTRQRMENLEEASNKEKEEQKLKKKIKNKCTKSVENSCKLSEKSKAIKPKKCKERTESVESRSKMAAFLPARQLWSWSGKGFRRPGAKGRARKEFYKTIQRGKERITVGDCAVFLSTGRPDRPYIGRIESMWESWGTNMIVRVKWFYHPEETVGCPATLEYPGALFESPHVDENDVQTISHKCEVLPLKEYTAKIGNDPHRYETIYDNNDIYYLAGYYDPTNTTLKMEPGVK